MIQFCDQLIFSQNQFIIIIIYKRKCMAIIHKVLFNNNVYRLYKWSCHELVILLLLAYYFFECVFVYTTAHS